jgi:dienelactone hydrolase
VIWWRRQRVRLSIALALCLCAACGPAPTPAQVSVNVTPTTSAADQPLDVVVSGLPAGQSVQLVMTSTDIQNVAWSSNASFTAGASGRLDLAAAEPQSGSYSGASGSGLLWSMQRKTGTQPYFWGDGPQTFAVTALVNGQMAGTTSFQRRFGTNRFSVANESLAAQGFIGTYYAPPPGPRRPAILFLGGSEGGIPGTIVPLLLAAEGYPTLALAYFGEAGLPHDLLNVPLEYFATALRWLAAQPGVDPSKVVVRGDSRGSEAALLLGVDYPALVHGVIAAVPSNVALCSFPRCRSGAAWTLNGAPIPYTSQVDTAQPTDDPGAVIPVERTQGPVFLDCGGRDRVWTSCQFAQAIEARLVAHNFPHAHELEAFPDAGHGVGALVPFEPGFTLGTSTLAGRSPDSNERAAQLLWPKLQAFLAAL